MRYAKLFLIFTLLISSYIGFSQTTTVTIFYSGAQAWGCCSVCGTDYMCIGSSGCGCCQPAQQTKTFMDPVPPGNMVIGMTITYYAADCSAPNVPSNINGCAVGNSVNTAGNNSCACGTCNPVWCYASYPTGMSNYNYGGMNTLYSNPPAGTEICVQRVEIKIDYTPGTPPSGVIPMPGPITGTNPVCPGGTYTYSVPPTAGATLWTWTVPAGSVINSGQGTTSISVTFGATAGNICVTASSCTSTSPTFCWPVSFAAPPVAPSPVTATPPTIACGGTSNLNATSAGNTIRWYTVPTGGTPFGTSASGVNFPVSPTTTTTYYAEAFSCVPSATRTAVTVTVSGGPGAPTPVTATPPTIVCGGTSNLNAISAGNTINWYTVPTGGTAIGTSASGVNFPVSPSSTTTYYAEAMAGGGLPGSVNFNYTGSIVNWSVPAGVTEITITAQGAQGGSNTGTGGMGAVMTGTFTVTPGQTLSILVGQHPVGAGSYAGGGGGTFVAMGASYATATPMIVAGGGGGASSSSGGDASITTNGNGPAAGTGGNGATSTSCGGGGGGFYTSGGNDVLTSPSFISYGGSGFRQGGAGGLASGYQSGGFGGGAAPNYYGSCNMQAGAGGGYSGGSGYNSGSVQATGYGGGSYNGGTSQNNSIGNAGDGIVTITWAGAAGCYSTTRTAVTVTVTTPPVPNPVTATPSTITCGGTSNLNATSAGATINWYTVPTGGTCIGTSASGANFPVTPAATTTYYAEGAGGSGLPGSQTFNYTGALQTFTVPAGVTTLTVDAFGAEGFGVTSPTGLGGNLKGTITVIPGQTLNVYVGGAGTACNTGGYNGGALATCSYANSGTGGGASDIRIGGIAIANRVLVAGGGGGAGYNCGSNDNGGPGGGSTGGTGMQCGVVTGGGVGGTQIAGGAGGVYAGWTSGSPGTLGVGGAAGAGTGGGGGGGGYYGGGGGSWGGGGGGSNWITATGSTTITNAQGVRTGNGQIIISWTGSAGCVSATRTAVTVTVTVPGAPTATATPSTICPGATSNLNGVSAGGNINWYTVPTGGTAIGTSASGVNFPVTPAATTTYYAEAAAGGGLPGSQTFTYSGSIVNWTVPAGVTSITATAKGAQGGQYSIANPGGVGAIVTGTFAVTPGQVLSILVGQQPPPNLSVMPGGGGGTYVALGASYATATPMLVAGGGGGSYSGGVGQSGQITNITTTGDGGGPVPGTNGNGAAGTTCGGGGGGFYTSGGNDLTYGTAGAGGAGFRQGGAGGVSTSGYQTGGFGGGATADYVGSCNTTAGSGGGYSGGSGQNSGAGIPSGWGGGSYNSGTAQSNSVGNTGDGQVIITWAGAPGCISATRTPVTVTIGFPAAPPATATPANICVAGTSNLNAVSAGNSINWYTVPTGGTTIGSSLSGVNFPVSPAVTTTYYAEAQAAGALSATTYSFTNCGISGRLGPTQSNVNAAYAATNLAGLVTVSTQGVQVWTAPATGSYTFVVKGASGGSAAYAGYGATVTGTVNLTSGTPLNIIVGQMGSNHGTANSDGGGGGSYVTAGGTLYFAAGGGGGSAQTSVVGQNASTTTTVVNGSASQFGSAGAGYSTNGINLTYGVYTTVAQSFTNGGNGQAGGQAGGWPGSDYGDGGFGGGGSSCSCSTGGGGGGGGYAGGGGGGGSYTSGYGGSSYIVGSATSTSSAVLSSFGNGSVTITFSGTSACNSATRTPVTVTVSPPSVGGSVTGGGTICVGNTTPVLTLSGYTGLITNWEVSNNGGASWTPIVNTLPTYSTTISVGGTYWYRAVVQSGACAPQSSGYTVVTVPIMSVISPTTGTSGMCNIMSPNNWVYILDPADKLITSVFDATGGNNLMNTTAYLTIDPTVQIHPYTGEPYLQRHVQITPVSSGIADVKLYFTQAEFLALQAAVPAISSINDLVVTKFNDVGVWAGAVYFPTPIATANDPWPGVHSLRISVSGFSKFYIHARFLGGPLPVNLLSYSGRCENSKVTLNWSTASEVKNDFFTIERTKNGEQWEFVSTVKGAGNSNQILNYTAEDDNPMNGISYYRLSQTDFDGTTKSFGPTEVNCASSGSEVSVYPNPFNEDLVVSYRNVTNNNAHVKIVDILGNIILDHQYELQSSGTDSFILNLGNIAPGLYYIEFKSGDYCYHTRVVKN